jgi:hypothetical protein
VLRTLRHVARQVAPAAVLVLAVPACGTSSPPPPDAYPPRELDTSGAPDAATPKAGDLAYYAPWGNLALFYRDGQHSPGLVILGRLNHDEDTERLANADRVTIETVS